MSKKSTKGKSNKTISTIVTIIFLIVLAYFGGENILEPFTAESQQVNAVEVLDNVMVQTGDNCIAPIDINEDALRVYFFDVGQADSILIVNNGESMLIDAGNNGDGNLVVNNLKTIGITKLNYVVGTHPHEDHIGGLDDVINNFKIQKVMMPKTTTNTKTYENVIDAVANKNLKITVPKVGTKFNVGNAECEVMSIEDNQENLNWCSIVIKLEYDGVTYLFTGDAEEEQEAKRTWPKVDILKAGHHGSSSSSSKSFLNQVQPSMIVISVGKDNDYGHPHKETLQKFNKLGSSLYRTDQSGNILLIQTKK